MDALSLDVHALRLFVAVAEELHFGRAAQRLHMSQPPLSQQIKRLEQRLGGRLFVRDNRNVRLSELGAALLDDARDLLQRLAALERRAQVLARGGGGHLRVGYVGPVLSQLVAPAVSDFLQRHPSFRIELRRLGTQEQLREIAAGQLQLGIVRLHESEPAELSSELVFREKYWLCTRAVDSLAKRPRVPLRALDGRELIGFPRETQPALYDALHRCLRAAGAHVNEVQTVATKEDAIALVRAGLGVAIVPASTRVESPELAFRPLSGALPSVLVYAVSAPASSSATRELIAHLKRRAALIGRLDPHARARRRR